MKHSPFQLKLAIFTIQITYLRLPSNEIITQTEGVWLPKMAKFSKIDILESKNSNTDLNKLLK